MESGAGVSQAVHPGSCGHEHGRSLSTARAVLRVLALLTDHPEGVRAADVAAALGGSLSTTYYLLASLCDEGFVVHARETSLYYATAEAPSHTPPPSRMVPSRPPFADAVDEVYERTGKRSYLAVLEPPRIVVTAMKGRQGLPALKGVGPELKHEAHALALGKVVLSTLSPSRLRTHLRAWGLRAFAPRTITDARVLAAELERVRRLGVAVDREEYARGFCCIAAPIIEAEGELAGALGVSMTPRCFAADGAEIAAVVKDTAARATRQLGGARFQPS